MKQQTCRNWSVALGVSMTVLSATVLSATEASAQSTNRSF